MILPGYMVTIYISQWLFPAAKGPGTDDAWNEVVQEMTGEDDEY